MFATALSDWSDSDNGIMHIHSKMAKVFKSNRMVETMFCNLYSQPGPGCVFKYIQHNIESGAEGLLADLVSYGDVW